MRKYLKNNVLFEHYIKTLKTGEYFHLTIKDISRTTGYTTNPLIEWFEITDLGGMDFRFEYKAHMIYKSKLKTQSFHFKYRNGKLLFKRKSLTTAMSNIISYRIPELNIRVPDIAYYYTHTPTPKPSDRLRNIFLNGNHKPYDNYDELDKFIKSRCVNHKNIKLFTHFKQKITKDMSYLEFDELLTNMSAVYLESYYDDVKLDPAILEIIHADGWTLIGLDELDELIEINLMNMNDWPTEHLYFRKGDECFSITNVFEKPQLNRAGNLSKKLISTSIYDLVDLIYPDEKVARPVVMLGQTSVYSIPMTINLNELNGE